MKKQTKSEKEKAAMDSALERRGLKFGGFNIPKFSKGKNDKNLITRLRIYNIENSYD